MQALSSYKPQFGAFVVSLDFELHWGVRDKRSADGPYRRNLLGARGAVMGMLELFEEFGVRATWATVGFLFARSRRELVEFSPSLRPQYRNPRLDAYAENIGESEAEDPLHYAPSLIAAIRRCPGQELASHTFSHYYCGEPGQDIQAFDADLAAAVAIARQWGVELRSLIFPRNQVKQEYLGTLRKHGFVAYRTDPTQGTGQPRLCARAVRLADAYIDLCGDRCTPWSGMTYAGGLCDVRASAFLRAVPQPEWMSRLHVRRICRDLRRAARTGSIFHLWWHPHNFGAHVAENLDMLREILKVYRELKEEYDLRSMHMADVAAVLRPEMAEAWA
jgi:peptidoglycan/xylan/chitin deacetylase (PgdA/CDA1 family)